MADDAVHVLLVEDDEQDYVITREFLAQATGRRFVLRWVTRLADALPILGAGGVNVVLLDFSLPDSRGWSTFERTRDHAPHIPIILLTGMEDETLGLRALQEGAQDYLFKGNVSAELLSRSIRYAIERKRVELSLTQYQEHLEELVADRTTELSWANEELRREVAARKQTEAELQEALRNLRERDRAQSEFVSNVSHELKTPLASLIYAIENMIKGVVGEVPEKAQSYLSMMKEDCLRLSGTINDVLDMSRIDARRLHLNLLRVPFDQLARRAVESIRLQAERKNLTLALETDRSAGFVQCDAHRMERVIFNLLNNAIKFTNEGGAITVVAGRDPQEPSKVFLSVTDNGIGIPPQFIERITERYFRVGEHVCGSGLGLSLSKDIVQMHSGSMSIRSPPPGRSSGTQVMIHVPAVDAPAILAVEPDPASSREIEQSLRESGYRITLCPDCDAAIKVLGTQTPDLLIVASGNGSFDALEVIGHACASAPHRCIPTILLCRQPPEGVQAEILRSLHVPVVKKPVTEKEFLFCVEQAVMGRPRHEANST